MPREHSNFWDHMDEMQLEDAVSELDFLGAHHGWQMFISGINSELERLRGEVPYIQDIDQLRMHQGYMQSLESVLTFRVDLKHRIEAVLSDRSEKPAEVVERRQLNERGL